MGVYGVYMYTCINNSPLKLTPFNGCKFYAFIHRHGFLKHPVTKEIPSRYMYVCGTCQFQWGILGLE